MKFLVIVESPAKTKKIQAFLNTIKNHTFIVDPSNFCSLPFNVHFSNLRKIYNSY